MKILVYMGFREDGHEWEETYDLPDVETLSEAQEWAWRNLNHGDAEVIQVITIIDRN